MQTAHNALEEVGPSPIFQTQMGGLRVRWKFNPGPLVRARGRLTGRVLSGRPRGAAADTADLRSGSVKEKRSEINKKAAPPDPEIFPEANYMTISGCRTKFHLFCKPNHWHVDQRLGHPQSL